MTLKCPYGHVGECKYTTIYTVYNVVYNMTCLTCFRHFETRLNKQFGTHLYSIEVVNTTPYRENTFTETIIPEEERKYYVVKDR